MSVAISWSFTGKAGAEQITASSSRSVDAIDKVEVSVPPGTTTVQVQPGDAGEVSFFSIWSSVYGTNIRYSADSGSWITLDSYHVFVGPGAVALIGPTQQNLMFINNGVLTAQVSIVAGRTAT